MLAVATLVLEETDAVTAPAPSPPPLATGTVLTVEKVLDDVDDRAAVEAMVDEDWPGADAEVEDPEDELDTDADDEPDEPPSTLMLCQDPDISPYTYWDPPVE